MSLTASDIISRITIREADKLDKVSSGKDPLTSEQLENLEVLAKIDRALRPSPQAARAAGGQITDDEALRIIEQHSS